MKLTLPIKKLEEPAADNGDVHAQPADSSSNSVKLQLPTKGTESSSRVSTALPSSRGSGRKSLRPSSSRSSRTITPRHSGHLPSSSRSSRCDTASAAGSPTAKIRRGAVVAGLLPRSDQKKEEEAQKIKEATISPWSTIRKAVYATRFWKRMALMSAKKTAEGQKLDLGSLKQFVDRRKLKDINWTDDTEDMLRTSMQKVRAEERAAATPVDNSVEGAKAAESPLQTRPSVPDYVALCLKGRRREVPRLGDKLSLIRIASPRHQQLRAMLPRLEQGSAQPSPPKVRPMTTPSPRQVAKMLQDGPRVPSTSFTLSLASGVTKPRAEFHPLLSAIEGMQEEDVFNREPHGEQAALAQRLDELRWGEQRSGPWTSPPERRKPLVEDGALRSPSKQHARQERLLRLHAHDAASRRPVGTSSFPAIHTDMERLMHLMDPERSGVVSPDVFVPLMFWLGLTRRRGAALMTLELAFGPGDIQGPVLRKLTAYIEVQLRLVEGLRRLARLESFEHLCEFITDMGRLRTWFHTTKRDTTGRVDIVEVQNLFARMEVTSDRQALFRFLSYVAHNDVLPVPGAIQKSNPGAELQARLQNRTFGIADFASLLCRCAVAWCLHRTLVLINPDAGSAGADGSGPFHVPLGVPDSDREAQLRWTQLQRKIIVSLLVNHRFWGRESRTVLASLNQPALTTLGHQLTPEQWLSLFQRVRAQGIASTLPTGDEADDPEFLLKKASRVRGTNVGISLEE